MIASWYQAVQRTLARARVLRAKLQRMQDQPQILPQKALGSTVMVFAEVTVAVIMVINPVPCLIAPV